MSDPAFELFDRAKPYLDEGWDGNGWRPSALLVIGYCILKTGPTITSAASAADFANETLAEARRRYRAGFLANPFSVEPVPR